MYKNTPRYKRVVLKVLVQLLRLSLDCNFFIENVQYVRLHKRSKESRNIS
jgi:hypothetical protein